VLVLSFIFLCFLLQVSSKDESFLDLSVDVEQNTSITHCLRYRSFFFIDVTLAGSHQPNVSV